MAFLDAQLDPLITQGCRMTVEFSRTKVYTMGGKLSQAFNWSNPKHSIDLSWRARPKEEYQLLLDFFYVVMANAATGFRVKCWSDFTLTKTNSTLTFISGTDWQIQRMHAAGAATYLRNITKPVADSVSIYRTRSGVESLAAATVDETTGIAAIVGHAGGDTYTATGEFDLPMTFSDDKWVSNLQATTADLWLSPDPILLEELLGL